MLCLNSAMKLPAGKEAARPINIWDHNQNKNIIFYQNSLQDLYCLQPSAICFLVIIQFRARTETQQNKSNGMSNEHFAIFLINKFMRYKSLIQNIILFMSRSGYLFKEFRHKRVFVFSVFFYNSSSIITVYCMAKSRCH